MASRSGAYVVYDGLRHLLNVSAIRYKLLVDGMKDEVGILLAPPFDVRLDDRGNAHGRLVLSLEMHAREGEISYVVQDARGSGIYSIICRKDNSGNLYVTESPLPILHMPLAEKIPPNILRPAARILDAAKPSIRAVSDSYYHSLLSACMKRYR